ncbi:MAG TPA: hypothetical protein PLN52_17265 [Opitutaceae bacterium]|nr:hypothetical protein [Opitutaceae bacterium]
MKPLPLLLLVFAFAPILQAQDRTVFAFSQTARASPERFSQVTTGPFGLPFVGVPKWRFLPQPKIPPELKGELAVVRAALHLGKDGEVKAVKLLECSVDLKLVEKEALAFFKRVVYFPETRSGKAIEFETDVILRLNLPGA